jgi:cystathionine gamma-synthase
MTKRRDETLAASVGVDSDAGQGAVMPPLYLSTNYSFAGFNQKRRYDYSRSGNPTRDVLADAIAQLEGGIGAVVTATGMAAIDLVLNLVDHGQTVIAPHDCYGGTWRLLCARARKQAFKLVQVDQGDPVALDAALAQGAALVLIETPSNPLMRVVDVADIARRAKAAGAKVAADNTFLSPALQKPLELGADIVIHSTTKYLNGHSDVVGGVVVAKHQSDLEQLAWWANCTGVTGSPFDSYMTLRGVRTLFARIERQQASAQRVAEHLEAHPAVTAVHYPGLPSHAGHELAKRQQKGFGAMLSFELAGDQDAVIRFVEGLELLILAESLGGVESLVAHPPTMTHAAMDEAALKLAGISPTLLRVSIGLEHHEDIIADLDKALARAAASPPRLATA